MYKAEWQPCRPPQLLSGMPDVTLVAPPCPKYKTPLPLWLLCDKLFLNPIFRNLLELSLIVGLRATAPRDDGPQGIHYPPW
jgi:hypothetical protein